MNTLEQNQKLFSNKNSVGDPTHCGCDHCRFYAENIIKNKELIQFLQSFGVNAQKADEAWCYMEEDGFKNFIVDYFGIYSEVEGTFTFENVTVKIGPIFDENQDGPTHWMGIDAAFPIQI